MKNKEFQAVSHLVSIARTVQELNFHFEKNYDLSLTQWLVLSHLKDLPGCSAQDLSEALNIHPSSLTPALKRLKRKHFIAISQDPKDSRRKNLFLTRGGRDHILELTPQLRPLFSKMPVSNIKTIDLALNQKKETYESSRT